MIKRENVKQFLSDYEKEKKEQEIRNRQTEIEQAIYNIFHHPRGYLEVFIREAHFYNKKNYYDFPIYYNYYVYNEERVLVDLKCSLPVDIFINEAKKLGYDVSIVEQTKWFGLKTRKVVRVGWDEIKEKK